MAAPCNALRAPIFLGLSTPKQATTRLPSPLTAQWYTCLCMAIINYLQIFCSLAKHEKSLSLFGENILNVRHSTAPSYPSIENLFNVCWGHPPFCLPPGTAQRLPDRIQKVFRHAAIYSANSSRWHKCKSGWSLKTEKIHWLWHVYIDTTHTIQHPFLTWTSLYPSTFLKLKSNICGNPLASLWLFDLQYYLNCT